MTARTLKILSTGCAILTLAALVMQPAAAKGRTTHMLVRSASTIAYSNRLDVVTVFAAEMQRYRQELVARGDGTSLATMLTPTSLSDEFSQWTWRAADGSLLQSVAGRGLWLIGGDCLARLCAATNCIDAGWPVFTCSDGRKRTMVVDDFQTIVFDGVPYGRLRVVDQLTN